MTDVRIGDAIRGFRDEFRFLSNFYQVPFTAGGIVYPSVEHYFQAMKTLDEDDRRWIASLPSAKMAKQAGSRKGWGGHRITLREDWNDIREQVMMEGLRAKFSHPELRQLLLATGLAELEETNTWEDRFWGVCRGEGENRLGVLLMQLRESIQNNNLS